jgi:hypothetical protein
MTRGCVCCVSQYNFQPFTCTIAASCHAGDIRKQALIDAAGRLGLVPGPPTHSPPRRHPPAAASSSRPPATFSEGEERPETTGSTREWTGEGEGHGDGEGGLGMTEAAETQSLEGSESASGVGSSSEASRISASVRLGPPDRRKIKNVEDILDHYEAAPMRTPRFGGSGAAFDAGGQWLSTRALQSFRASRTKGMTSTQVGGFFPQNFEYRISKFQSD